MSSIPDDIWKVATLCASQIPTPCDPETEAVFIALAILAERERCAGIADSYGWPGRFEPKPSTYDEGCRDTGDYIAAAIRKGNK